MRVFLSKKMHYFMVIMEQRHFAKAAEILCISASDSAPNDPAIPITRIPG